MILDMIARKSPNRIARLFLENPTREMQISEIISASELAKMSVLRWAKELEKSGILGVSKERKARLYRLNKNSPVVRQLRILYNVDYISEKTSAVKDNAQIFVYGSFARGDNTEKSDIDLLVIGKKRDIVNKLKSADKRIKVSFYTPVEWSMASRKDRAFFDSVEKDKIQLR